MSEEPKKPKPKTVDPVNSDYQPTKAELDDEFDPDIPRDTVEEQMHLLGSDLTETVNIRRADRLRNRRSRRPLSGFRSISSLFM